MADPQQRALAGTPFRPSAGAWNKMLDAARAFEAGAGVPGGVAVPHLLVRVRNDTGGDLADGSVLALGVSILDITVPLRVLPAPMFAGDTPAAVTDAFCVLIEPIPDGKFGLAAISGVVPVEVNVTDAGHGYATPTAASAARLTSAASGPARILDRESGTGNVDAVVLLGGGAGGGSDWKLYRITGRTGADVPDTPPIDSGVEVELALDVDGVEPGDQIDWVTKSGGDTFSLGVRVPSKDRDESRLNEILIPIPVGQVVLGRPSASLAGYYELTPWGGLKRTITEHLYRVCVQCVDVGGGIYKMRTKMAIRMISEDARDRRAMWQDPATAEANLEDNTALGIDPDPETDI
jgi:hypothetical protein